VSLTRDWRLLAWVLLIKSLSPIISIVRAKLSEEIPRLLLNRLHSRSPAADSSPLACAPLGDGERGHVPVPHIVAAL
jgi:hypothetical protein